ncbi:hypothetical protein BGW42_006175 [Actinomortierella wolfii]|nr:hypothetical protein BGW42_006175 [Actinomortierella wolfii]
MFAPRLARGYATASNAVKIPAVLHGIEGRYATALYSAAAKKQALETVESDLKQVKAVVEKDTKLRAFLENPTINRNEKKDGVKKMLGAGKYSDLTKNFFDTLAENGRLYDTVKIINSYDTLMSAHRGEVQVTITSAKELDAKDINKIKGFLSKSSYVSPKQTLVVSNKVNPSILGGLVVEFGDKTIDLSVSSKVNKLNQLLQAMRLSAGTSIAITFGLATVGVFASTQEAFHEELVLKPLQDGSVYSHFQFTTHLAWPSDARNSIEASQHLSGTGVELSAWLRDNDKTDKNWKGLVNTLSGLFCASLNFIDETITVEPRLSFRNDGVYNVYHQSRSHAANQNDTRLRYGSLPHENVCTENLTPWIKLLPCKSKAGIASLLKSHKLFDSRFYSMAIHVRPVCEDELCTVKSLELVQSISTVIDVVRSTGSSDWTMDILFERQITQACPLASSSNVVVITSLPNGKSAEDAYELIPAPGKYSVKDIKEDNHRVSVYNLLERYTANPNIGSFELSMRWTNKTDKSRVDVPGVVAHRYFTGYGQERGGLTIELHNHNSEPVEALYFDTLPWFLKLYLHTMTIQVDNSEINSLDDIVLSKYYQPAIDRASPAVLEMKLRLPAQTMVKFSVQFDKVFLKYTEHPPDANRGFDVGCAVLTAFLPRGQGQIGFGGLDYLRSFQGRDQSLLNNGLEQVRVYTEPLMVSLPTPDFSMPYNVITLTCTVIVLFFGSMFNLLTRNFEVVEPKKDK